MELKEILAETLWIIFMFSFCPHHSSCQLNDDILAPYEFLQPVSAGSAQIPGNTKVLLCQVSGRPAPVFRWKKNGVFLTTNNVTETAMRISSIKKEDAGFYQCVASNQHGAILSNTVNVLVAYLVPFDAIADQIINVNRGEAVIIPIPPVDSYPAATVTWYDGSTAVPQETQRYHVTLDHNLVLLSTNQNDNDKIFRATAVNNYIGVNKNTHRYILKVQNTQNLVIPQILVPPKHLNVTKGDQTAVFECVANSNLLNYLTINWYKLSTSGEKTLITADASKYMLSLYKRRLTIITPITTDSMSYECEVIQSSNPGEPSFQAVRATANLTVLVPPRVSSSSSLIINKDYGGIAEVPCQPSGVPTPTVQWYRNAIKLENTIASDTRYEILENSNLQITGVKTSDNGVFQCFATNSAGEANRASWLRVLSFPPDITQEPQNKSVIAGGMAQFECPVTGAPKPSITWSKVTGTDRMELRSSAERITIFEDKLLISVTEPSDTGLYVCNATNTLGSDFASAQLNVAIRTRIITPPQNISVVKGSTTVMTCEIEKDSTVEATWVWQHDTKEISSTDTRKILLSKGNLEIRQVRSDDIGRYDCFVYSVAGNDTGHAYLKVIELPHAPSIESVGKSETAERAIDIQWIANFDGNVPILVFTIQYRLVLEGFTLLPNEAWITANDSIPSTFRAYTVKGLYPARTYEFRIRARNQVGDGPFSKPSNSVSLPEEPPSGPPMNVAGSPRSNSSIILQWLPPDADKWNGPLLGFIIKYKPSGYPDDTENAVNITSADSRQHILVDLIIFQEYLIAIAAYNAKGVGIFSDYTRSRTLEGTPTAPPTDLTVVALTSTSIRLQWTPPHPQKLNGINQGYKINREDMNSSGIVVEIIVPSNTSNMEGRQVHTMTNLKKFNFYSFTVLCYTNVGDGPKSIRVQTQTNEDVPDAVRNLTFDQVLDTSLRVNWTEPLNINGVLQGYTLSHMQKNQTSTIKSLSLPAAVHSHRVEGLTATTLYTISVFARSRVGAGPAVSADIASGVPPVRPGAPRNVAVATFDARQVTLTFIQGFKGHTSISRWIVEARVGSSLDWTEVFTKTDPKATSIVVTGLRPHTDYIFRMYAENVAGKSDPSEATSQIKTLQAPPSYYPKDIVVRAVNETALIVRWKPLLPSDWNGLNRGYRVEYQLNGISDSASTKLLEDETANSLAIGYLEEFTEYLIRVAAYNQAGSSLYSNPILGVTRETVPSAGPSSVNASALNSTSIYVSWEEVPILHQNGIIRGHKVKYRIAGSDTEFDSIDIDNSTVMDAVITNLRKYVQYEIEVLAYTRVGDGVPHTPGIIIRTIEDVPGPPSSIFFPEVTHNTVQVFWSPPLEPNGVIGGYRVSHREENRPPNYAIIKDELGPETRNFFVQNLIQETFYVFEITARTKLGWGQAASVRVGTFMNRVVPLPPEKPIILPSKVGNRWVEINWTPAPENNAPVRNFSIQTQKEGGAFVDIPDYVPYTVTFYKVTGLTPDTWYKFRVAAWNDVGRSEYSISSDQRRTSQDAPDAYPAGLKVTPMSRNSVTVEWQALQQSAWNGSPVGYQIMYTKLVHSRPIEPPLLQPAFSTSRELTNLAEGYDYDIRVCAYNSAGNGPYSSPVDVYVGEAVPTGTPRNVTANATSSTAIMVGWLPPEEEKLNGDLLGYKIYSWIYGESVGSTMKATVGAGKTTATLDNLRKWTLYQITMLAYNAAGDGPNITTIVSARTMEGAPGKPGELSLIMISLNAVNISWTEPANPNGVILEYEVSYRQEKYVDGESRSVQVRTDAPKTFHIAQDLTENVKYIFSVRAKTSVDWGPIREGNLTTGPQPGSPAKPGPPANKQTDSAITLTWQNGDHGEMPITGYIIQAQEKTDNIWIQVLTTNNPEPVAVIPFKNLKPGIEYQFRVIALNGRGISSPSNPSAFIKTPDNKQKPFYQQWWFLVIVALTGLILIIVVVSLLCITGHRVKAKKYKESAAPVRPPIHVQTHLPPPLPAAEDGGFSSYEARRSQRPQRKSQRSTTKQKNGLPPPYMRSPPRPSPGSVNYSDDDTKTYADDSSLSDKPSEISSSPEPSIQGSDSEHELDKDPYAFLPPPPFSSSYANQPIQQSWKRYNNPRVPASNAYSYTDSEADSSHYATSLNGGHIIMNNMAGSRAPLPGFSSFV